MDKLLTLEEWAKAVYGEHPPGIETLRRWARQSRLFPAPEKHGRTYFVRSTARYIDPSKPITVPEAPVQPRRGSLAERIMQERRRGKTS
ncbi:excisionase [Azospirillum canadense]|uniref:excisionase n=1 Tax=Azospirillum canadense TaxID=403962 RepID=UPI002227576C|nr:excisionase [Azospirillum canadense]MCW2242756.1 hypothetical protein [Azospirillum canadense]